MAEDRPTPEQEARRLYEDAEARVAKAAERVVSRDSFGEVLAMATENVVALTRMGFDAMDLVWSNLRLAGRRDITRLALTAGQAPILADGLLDGAGLGLLADGHAGLLVERVGRDLKGRGDRVEHPFGRLAQAALDLREVRIGDAGEGGELAHRQLAQLALAADDLAETLGWCSVGHWGFIVMTVRA